MPTHERGGAGSLSQNNKSFLLIFSKKKTLLSCKKVPYQPLADLLDETGRA
jgi:hypothetical protein